MTDPRTYLTKVIRMRMYLLQSGKNRQNEAAAHRAIKTLKGWLDFYPNASSTQVREFMRRHQGEIYLILPARKCKMESKLITQLNTILND